MIQNYIQLFIERLVGQMFKDQILQYYYPFPDTIIIMPFYRLSCEEDDDVLVTGVENNCPSFQRYKLYSYCKIHVGIMYVHMLGIGGGGLHHLDLT